MIKLKNKLYKISALLLLMLTVVSFHNKPFDFDGGYISNDKLFIVPGTMLAAIDPSKPSGCRGPITYQWQESPDGYTFTDIPDANGAKYKRRIIDTTTYLRRKAVCSGGDVAYTNVLSIIVGPPIPNTP